MNDKQTELQLAKILRALEYSAGVLVLKDAFPGPTSLDTDTLAGHYAEVVVVESVTDPDEPGRCVHRAIVTVVSPPAGHPPAAVAPETAATGLAKAVRAVAQGLELLVDSTHGMQGRIVRQRPARTLEAGVGAQDLELEIANGTTTEHFHPCPRFNATGGVGSVTLAWTLPPARFDRLRVVLIRKAGSSAPTSVSDGTAVTLSGDLATSKTDTIAAGTYSYSLFAVYDETHATPTTVEKYSAAATKTAIVVT